MEYPQEKGQAMSRLRRSARYPDPDGCSETAQEMGHRMSILLLLLFSLPYQTRGDPSMEQGNQYRIRPGCKGRRCVTMHEIELISEGTKTKVLLDGTEIQARKALFQYDVSCIPTVILELPLRKAVVKTDQALVLDEEGNVIEQ